MITLDEFFEKPADLRHPRLHNWKVRLEQPGAFATLEVSREQTEFGQARPEMHVQFRENGKLLPLETIPWDDDLNSGLLRLRVRSANPKQEAERFALGCASTAEGGAGIRRRLFQCGPG